jgi:hypothetical protein
VSAGAQQDLGNVRLDDAADGVKILGRELWETAAKVAGLGRGSCGGVAAGGVEEEDGGEWGDGGEVDLLEHLARGPDEWLVSPVLLEAGVHAEHGDDGRRGVERLGVGKKNPGDSGVLCVLVQVT